jgi:hypothetical protein
VRGYARAIGLDPAETVDEFCRLYLHGDRRGGTTIREIAVMSAEDPQYDDEHPFEERRRGALRQPASAWHAWAGSPFRALRARVATVWALYVQKPGRAERTS